jgi:antitoxin MazE
LIEQCGFGDAVEVRVENDRLTVTPERVPRQGWREAFLAAGSRSDGELLLEGLPENDFDL